MTRFNRKAKYHGGKVRLYTYVDTDTRKRIEAMADKLEMSVSEFLRELAISYCDQEDGKGGTA